MAPMRYWSSSTWTRIMRTRGGCRSSWPISASAAEKPFQVHDLLSGARYLWQGARNYVSLDPAHAPAHIFRIRRRVRTERDFDYFL